MNLRSREFNHEPRQALRVWLWLILVMPSAAMAAPLNDTIIAIVNSEAITLKDLRDYIGGIYRQLKVENKSAQEINEIMATYEQKGVNQLIEDRLILAAANEKGLEIRQEAVNKRLKEIKDRYSNEDAFVAALSAQGMTITDLKNKAINQMKAHYIVDIEVKQKIFVNPQDVTHYYEAHPDDFTRKTKYNLQSIYISFDKGRDEARKQAMEAHSRLVAGEDFEKLRQEYSELPSVGTIEEGQMVSGVEKVVFSLKLDEVSQPVEVEAGVYVFKVTGISPGHKASLVEAKNDIYNRLYDETFQKKFKEWIDKLRKKSYVEVRG